MTQEVAAILIVAVALAWVTIKLIRFLRSPEDQACTPEKCARCPMKSPGCEEMMKQDDDTSTQD